MVGVVGVVVVVVEVKVAVQLLWENRKHMGGKAWLAGLGNMHNFTRQ